jgi:hypothetical protein
MKGVIETKKWKADSTHDMCHDPLKVFLLFSIVILLIGTSIGSADIQNNKKTLLRQTHENNENILGTITVKWQSFFATGKLKELAPCIHWEQSDTRVFNFSEKNGVLQMNFTVICRQILINRTLFPRFVRYEFMLPTGGPYYYNEVKSSYCKSLSWKYCDITVGSNDIRNDLITDGNNVTLRFKVGVRTFPTLTNLTQGWYTESEPITLVPIKADG